MKKLPVLIVSSAILALIACDDEVSSSQKEADNIEATHEVDTLYLSSKDTVVIKDSIFLKDSVVVKDTVVLKDSVFTKDTIVLKDSILLKDTVYVIDSLTKGDTSCVVTDQGVSFKIQCKDKAPYTLNKATCNGKAYDPAESLCLDNTILAITDADTCKGVIFDSREYFCSASKKVVEKCNGKSYDADSLFCYFDKEAETYSTPKRCGGLEYDISKYECENDVVIAYCGETKFNAILVSGCREDGMLTQIRQYEYLNGSLVLGAYRSCNGVAYPISGKCFANNNCARFDWDECVECKEGYYGPNCNNAVTCVHGTQNNSTEATNGYCIAGNCDAGYYGTNCNMKVTCVHGAQNNTTTATNGQCKAGNCNAGWYGPNCSNAVTCVHGTQNNTTTATNGYCLANSCISGYTGANCDTPE